MFDNFSGWIYTSSVLYKYSVESLRNDNISVKSQQNRIISVESQQNRIISIEISQLPPPGKGDRARRSICGLKL